jgi:hypothetical protein
MRLQQTVRYINGNYEMSENITHFKTSGYLTAVSMKMIAFWDIALCSLAEVEQRSRSAYCLHQGNSAP